MSSGNEHLRNLFDNLDDEPSLDAVANVEIYLNNKKTKKRVTIVEPDLEAEDEDEENDQRKTLLFKDSKLKFKNSPALMKLDRQKLLAEESRDEDEEYQAIPGNDQPNAKGKKNSAKLLHSPPPITIGKIKIFKPRRLLRQRLRRVRAILLFLASLIFLAFLFYNLELLPVYIRSLFGLDASETASKNGKRGKGECNQVVSSKVWQQNFPMLTIESALRMVDVNNDSVLDVIVPFGTGVDAAYYDTTLCLIYFNQTKAESNAIGCGGGFMALDGKSGEPLWAQYTAHELFASSCTLDLNGDAVLDCIFAGRMASLLAVDGRSGTILWSIANQAAQVLAETSNFYTPLPIPKDVDGDGVPEVVVMHGGDPLRKRFDAIRNVARLMVISGKTGKIITSSFVPDGAESYYSPQLLVQPDGTTLVLYGTGGETHAGGLYVVGLDALLNGQVQHASKLIFRDCCKGVITPPVLIDITGDQILDIVMANFNSTVMAIDGLTFDTIWSKRYDGAETYSSPTVGFFNDDDVPDFGVNYQFGPGFPVYRSAQFDIIDGRNGKSLLKKPIGMQIGTQSSPLTISTFASNDIFLYWFSSCSNETNVRENNKTIDDSKIGDSTTSVFQSSRMDFCRLRFGSSGHYFSQLRTLTPNPHNQTEALLYDSNRDQPKVLEKINFTAIAYNWFAVNGAGYDQSSADQTSQQQASIDSGLWPIQTDQIYDKKYKKWSSRDGDGLMDNDLADIFQEGKRLKRTRPSRYKRHVGLHNGDEIQRVISTGTLAPSLEHSADLVDGSIDLIFATYTFPPVEPSSAAKMSPGMRKCYELYMRPEKETELRLNDDESIFKKLAYDHDAYEAAIKELCAKQTQDEQDESVQTVTESEDPLKTNDWLKDFGSLTIHRVKIKCYEKRGSRKRKPIAIKEYRYQWWPSYLGIKADAIVNLS